MKSHVACVLLLAACGAEIVDDHKTCVPGEDEPGMACDVEGQTCGYADDACTYSSRCEKGVWTQGTTQCAGDGGGGAGQGGATSQGAGGAGEPGPTGCPASAPTDPTICDDAGLVCTYGDSPGPLCRTVATCLGTQFEVAGPDPKACALESCPASAPSAGSECRLEWLTCGFDGGVLCSCTTCLGGPCGPPPPVWVCGSEPERGCPVSLPNAGTACGGLEGQECAYGNPCSGGQATRCHEATGAWEWVASPCPL